MRLAPTGRREWLRAGMRVTGVFVVLGAVLMGLVGYTTWMPGRSFSGERPASTASLDALRTRLEGHVRVLAVEIGERNTRFPAAYERAADYVRGQLEGAGYTVQTQAYRSAGETVRNLVAELPGTTHPGQIVVVGAHYDTVRDTPGADDNASGTAAVIELARAFAASPLPRTVRFVLFANEEPPAFQNDDMGSLVYARACRAAGDDVVAMLSVESVGFFTSAEDTQVLPSPLLRPFLGSRGDFVAFVSDWRSRPLVREAVAQFRTAATLPSEGISAPEFVSGIGFSDHWSFWQVGYPAVMVTDTALFRNTHYHKDTDLPDTLDGDALARVTEGLGPVVRGLASSQERW